MTEAASSGTDTVLSSATFTLGNNIENLTLTGSSNIHATGNTLDNTLTGNSGANSLTGSTGNDTYVVDNAGDVVVEGASAGTDVVLSSITYTLASNVENLTLTGSSNINATGNTLDNILTGNSGNNTLTGSTGNDTYVVDSASDALIENASEGTDIVQSSIGWTLAANFEHLVLTGSANINGTGNSDNNSITGNSGNNTLDGGVGNDTMAGGLGDDVYYTDSTSDVVTENASAGTDTIYANATITLGNNVENLVLTGSSNINGTGNSLSNTLVGNSGINTLSGGLGNDYYIIDSLDIVVASSGIDTVQVDFSYTLTSTAENLVLSGSSNINGTGSSGANTIIGNSGNNSLDGAGAADTLIGGAGDDVYTLDHASDLEIENASEGTDSVFSSVTHTLSANVENLTLTSTGNTNAVGNSLNNSLTGNSGINSLDGGGGADTMAGGTGNDTYIVDDVGDIVTEAAASGTDTVRTSVTYTLSSDVENMVLTGSSNINATGNSLANTITGNGGNNTLDGGAGNDSMSGGAGDDTFIVDSTSDTLSETSGTDTVISSVSWTLATGYENLTLTGSSALTATGNTGNNIITGNSGASSLVGGSGNDTFILGSASNILSEGASAGTDTVQSDYSWTLAANFENLTLTGSSAVTGAGNSGDNTITGNSGASSLVGGTGNDIYIVSNSLNVIVENSASGTDAVQTSVSYTLAANVENITLLGSSSITATGNSGDNTLTGNIGTGTLAGASGNDIYLVVDAGNVVVENSAEGTDSVQTALSYALTSNVENLTLTGSSNVNGTGNSSVNTLTGNSGSNTLDGGSGADLLIGGAGNDVYLIDNGSDSVTENASEGTDIVLSSATYTLSSNIENLTLTGGTTINGTGNTLDNTIVGNSAVNILTAAAGNDYIDGGAGADSLIGGTGNDIYIVDDASDITTENTDEGFDWVQSGISWTLAANVEALTLTGSSNISGTGNSLDNILQGNIGANTLTGGAGNDVYTIDNVGDAVVENSGEGTDSVQSSITYTLGSYVENLYLTGATALNGTGNTLDNTIVGNSGSNSLAGGDGADVLRGEAGTDTLVGGNGNDTLDGGGGADTMVGGIGDDLYVYDDVSDVLTENSSEGTDTVETIFSYTLGSNIENLTLSGFGNINATGNSLGNTLIGNGRDNTLDGDTGSDSISGGDGLDTLIGDTGQDTFIFEALSAYNDIDIVTDFDVSTDNDRIDVSDLLADYDPMTDAITDFVKIQNSSGDSIISIDRDGTGGTYTWVQIATLSDITGLTDEAALVGSGNLIVT